MFSTLLSHLKKYFKRFSRLEQILLLLFILVAVSGTVLWQRQAGVNAEEVPKAGGSYTEGLVGSPQHLNPLLAPANDVDLDLAQIIYDGLYEFDSNLNLQPNLAAALPEISPDGKTYTIKLKDNAVWHDGQKLTADDAVFTYQLIQDPKYNSPLRFSWDRVSVEKLDERTLKLGIRESSATFIANLTVGILPKHIWESVAPENFALSMFNLEPIGSGPFQVSELKRGRSGNVRSITLKPFKQYYKAGPYLEKLNFEFYETTDDLISTYQARGIDGLGYVPFDRNLFIKARQGRSQFTLTLPQYQAVFINPTKNPAPLSDPKVRLALARSVNKKKIIDEVYADQAEEAYGPILPGHLGYHEQIPGAEMNIYDPEQARRLLEEAGWLMDAETGFRKDKLGRIITLELVTSNFSPNIRVAEQLKAMWQEIGVQVILKIETITDLEKNFIRPRNYELLLFSENVGADPDPFPFWHSSQVRDPGLNLTTFAVPEVDRLLVEGRRNQPPEDRAAKYRRFQELFVGQVPAIFITRGVFVYNIPAELKGVKLNTVVTPADRFWNIEEWHLKTKKIKNNQ